jgi:hypothetical protein
MKLFHLSRNNPLPQELATQYLLLILMHIHIILNFKCSINTHIYTVKLFPVFNVYCATQTRSKTRTLLPPCAYRAPQRAATAHAYAAMQAGRRQQPHTAPRIPYRLKRHRCTQKLRFCCLRAVQRWLTAL